MVIEHATRAFICKVPCCQPGNRHGLLYQLLR